jgi:imidazolonepropionase
MDWDTLWINLRLATMDPARDAPYGAVEGMGALATKDGLIAWLGPMAQLPPHDDAAVTVCDGDGRWATPGLIDCHTHLVYGGNRAGEFEQRLAGVAYEEIARRGGGILSTVRATREAEADGLYASAARRLQHFLDEGVTGIEIKSGYGLDRDTELKMLRVARELGEHFPVAVSATFLGAHALPPEFPDADAYIDFLCKELLPEVARAQLADAVDAFCEGIGFDLAQTGRYLAAAQSLGLPLKVHAEQLSNLGGTALAARLGARSADHLEYLDEEGIAAMAAAGTVAVLLPGAFYFLRETQLPPVDALRRAGVPIAVASDCNPGSSPAESLLLMLNMACTLFRLTPEEALAGVTRHAARALGWEAERGTLAVGKRADLVLWDIDHPAELAYSIGRNPCQRVLLAGETVLENA